jgi:hypothetical protein
MGPLRSLLTATVLFALSSFLQMNCRTWGGLKDEYTGRKEVEAKLGSLVWKKRRFNLF